MVHEPHTSSKTLVAAAVAAAFGVSAGAFAQTATSHTSPDEALANSAAAGQVTLTDQQNEQTLQYSSARNLRICNLSEQPESAEAAIDAEQRNAPEDRANLAITGPKGLANPVPLQVSYAGRTERIQPGDCYDFRARSVRLSAAQALPAGSALSVSIARVSISGFVNGRTEAYSGGSTHGRAASIADTRESMRQLKEQLKQDDEQERQANAELSQARDELARTTRQLEQAESQERHVASLEHRTADAARQQPRSAGERPQNAGQERQSAQQNEQTGGTPR